MYVAVMVKLGFQTLLRTRSITVKSCRCSSSFLSNSQVARDAWEKTKECHTSVICQGNEGILPDFSSTLATESTPRRTPVASLGKKYCHSISPGLPIRERCESISVQKSWYSRILGTFYAFHPAERATAAAAGMRWGSVQPLCT
jgi:hypothetical protein